MYFGNYNNFITLRTGSVLTPAVNHMNDDTHISIYKFGKEVIGI